MMISTRFLVMDVDGTLTDGKIYMGQNGELMKAFDIKDGCGILLELPLLNVIPIIITARESKILENRCAELKIKELYQGVNDKLNRLKSIIKRYGSSLAAVAYAGDDLPDIPCMKEVKRAGGIVLCPANAIPEIKAISDYVSDYKAGEGAVRDMIHFLKTHNSTDKTVQEKIDGVITWICSNDFTSIHSGIYENDQGLMYSIQEYYTKPEDECKIESHRHHIDIQYMIEGTEYFITYSSSCLSSGGVYDLEKDVELWKDGVPETQSILVPNSMIVVHNGQPHKGAICYSETQKVKKLVCKIPINIT